MADARASLLQSLQLDNFVVRVQEKLLPPSVGAEVMRRAALVLRPQDYEEVVAEREAARQCGYPQCGEALGDSKAQFRVSLSMKKVYKAHSAYCSERCFEQSSKFLTSLSPDPVYLRQLRPGSLPSSPPAKRPASSAASRTASVVAVKERDAEQDEGMEPETEIDAASEETVADQADLAAVLSEVESELSKAPTASATQLQQEEVEEEKQPEPAESEPPEPDLLPASMQPAAPSNVVELSADAIEHLVQLSNTLRLQQAEQDKQQEQESAEAAAAAPSSRGASPSKKAKKSVMELQLTQEPGALPVHQNLFSLPVRSKRRIHGDVESAGQQLSQRGLIMSSLMHWCNDQSRRWLLSGGASQEVWGSGQVAVTEQRRRTLLQQVAPSLAELQLQFGVDFPSLQTDVLALVMTLTLNQALPAFSSEHWRLVSLFFMAIVALKEQNRNRRLRDQAPAGWWFGRPTAQDTEVWERQLTRWGYSLSQFHSLIEVSLNISVSGSSPAVKPSAAAAAGQEQP